MIANFWRQFSNIVFSTSWNHIRVVCCTWPSDNSFIFSIIVRNSVLCTRFSRHDSCLTSLCLSRGGRRHQLHDIWTALNCWLSALKFESDRRYSILSQFRYLQLKGIDIGKTGGITRSDLPYEFRKWQNIPLFEILEYLHLWHSFSLWIGNLMLNCGYQDPFKVNHTISKRMNLVEFDLFLSLSTVSMWVFLFHYPEEFFTLKFSHLLLSMPRIRILKIYGGRMNKDHFSSIMHDFVEELLQEFPVFNAPRLLRSQAPKVLCTCNVSKWHLIFKYTTPAFWMWYRY